MRYALLNSYLQVYPYLLGVIDKPILVSRPLVSYNAQTLLGVESPE